MTLLVTPEPAGIKCSKCGAILKVDEQCYQLRFGVMSTLDDFEACEDVEYWHVECPAPYCDHKADPVCPSVTEVMESPAYKVVMQEVERDSPSHRYEYKYNWKETSFKERFLTITLTDKENVYSSYDYKFAFIKCSACGVIQSV